MSARRPGALVISLDFELHWGVRHAQTADGPYRDALLGARAAIPRILRSFQAAEVAATWAVVGLLFARSRAEAAALRPAVLPAYRDRRLDPWAEPVGEGEEDDPLHYAPSLVEMVRDAPRQEIGTHTFSHFFCLADGASEPAFRADLDSAMRAARSLGVEPRSIVFPRNQVNADFFPALREAGIACYRGAQRSGLYSAQENDGTMKRAARLVDAHVALAGRHCIPWSHVRERDGLTCLAASFFLRPHAGWLSAVHPLVLRRICEGVRHAATSGEVVHLWWHPHNFGRNVEENLRGLEVILRTYRECRDRFGMESMGMAEAAAAGCAA